MTGRRRRRTWRRLLVALRPWLVWNVAPVLVAMLVFSGWTQVAVTLSLTLLFMLWVGLTPGLRPLTTFSWRVPTRIRYRSAGCKDWWASAYLCACGFSPADVSVLVRDGLWSQQELHRLGDELHRLAAFDGKDVCGVREMLVRAAATDLIAPELTIPALEGLCDVPPDVALAYFTTFDGKHTVLWAPLGTPVDLAFDWNGDGPPNAWIAGWAEQVRAGTVSWSELRGWLMVRPALRRGREPLEDVVTQVLAWRAAVDSENGPLWVAAGFGLEEAAALVRDGSAPTTDDLRVLAAMRVWPQRSKT